MPMDRTHHYIAEMPTLLSNISPFMVFLQLICTVYIYIHSFITAEVLILV